MAKIIPFKLLMILITLFLVGCAKTETSPFQLTFREYETIIKNNFKSTGKQPQVKNVSEVEKMLKDFDKYMDAD